MTACRGLGARRWERSRGGWREELGSAPHSPHAAFSSKAHFLETEQDSPAGVFGHGYKGQYLPERSPAVTLSVSSREEKLCCAEIPTHSA